MKSRWRWMRVYYFEPCKDELILNGVWPALQKLTSTGPEAAGFFQRKAFGGPNLLVGIRSVDSTNANQVSDAIGAYLKEHPSRTSISFADYDRFSRTLLSWERQSPEPALQPNNTVVECDEPANPLVKPGEFQEELRRFLCRSAECVVKWLTSVQKGEFTRQDVALHAMIALGWLANPQKLTSCVSFGSHAVGFLNKADRNRKLTEQFCRKYEDVHGNTIRHFVRLSVDALEHRSSPIPGIDDWLKLLRETMTTVYTGLVSGQYEIASVMQFQFPEDQRALVSLLDESPSLRAWQITINLVYLALNQLGLTALDRFYACYLLYRAVDDIYGGLTDIGQQLAEKRDTADMLPFFAAWEKAGPKMPMKLYSLDANPTS